MNRYICSACAGKERSMSVNEYFHEQYKSADFRVVPGHWPDFKTKEEVDEWLDTMSRIMAAFRKEPDHD